MIKAVRFDLDGTLLPMDNDEFTKNYFKLLAARFAPLGYDAQELVKDVWDGTAAMVKNDGSRTNEEAFWDRFGVVMGKSALLDRPAFEDFYRNEFNNARASCGFSKSAREAVELARSRGLITALATNPIFPACATESRIRWAGLEPEDFAVYTTYENNAHCKPNPEYYRDVANALGLEPGECAMVGNDVDEDMVAETLGMKVFLLTDCLINRSGRDIGAFPHGGFEELKQFIMSL